MDRYWQTCFYVFHPIESGQKVRMELSHFLKIHYRCYNGLSHIIVVDHSLLQKCIKAFCVIKITASVFRNAEYSFKFYWYMGFITWKAKLDTLGWTSLRVHSELMLFVFQPRIRLQASNLSVFEDVKFASGRIIMGLLFYTFYYLEDERKDICLCSNVAIYTQKSGESRKGTPASFWILLTNEMLNNPTTLCSSIITHREI